MDRISRFVVWICSKFDREQIIRIVNELTEVLANRHPEVMPKDDFKKNIRTIETTSSTPPRPLPLRRNLKSPH